MRKNINKNSAMKTIEPLYAGPALGSSNPQRFYYVMSQPEIGPFYIDDKKMNNMKSYEEREAFIVNKIERRKADIDKGTKVYLAKNKADAIKRAKREERDFKIVSVVAMDNDRKDRVKIAKQMENRMKGPYQTPAKQREDAIKRANRMLQEIADKRSRTRFKNPFKKKRDRR